MLCSQVNAVGKLTRCCFIFSTAVRQDKSDRELTGESCKMRFAETGLTRLALKQSQTQVVNLGRNQVQVAHVNATLGSM